MKKDFLSILDISKGELDQILTEAGHLKTLKKKGSEPSTKHKNSTRTHEAKRKPF
jgi:ornithine carbamoyltransferase